MKKMVRPAAMLLSVCMLFSLSGCFHRRIEEIDPDDFIDACEDVLELEEFDQQEFNRDYVNYTDYYIWHNYPDRYEVDAHYNKITDPDKADGSESLYVQYCLMDDDEDAEELFVNQTERMRRVTKNEILKDCYVEGEYGYLIVERENPEGTHSICAYYYVEDMYIETIVYSEEGYDNTEAFLKELGLPFRHK